MRLLIAAVCLAAGFLLGGWFVNWQITVAESKAAMKDLPGHG